jgi:hypothetical protein
MRWSGLLLLVLAASAIALLVSRDSGNRPAGYAPGPQPAPVAEPLEIAHGIAVDSARPEEDLHMERTSLGRGGTLASALEELSIPAELRPRLLRAAGDHVDLRRLSPRTGLCVAKDATGSPRALTLRAETERYLRITRLAGKSDEPPSAEWIDLPIQVNEQTENGVVESSVAQALGHARHGTYLTAAFADIFQWDIDLLVEPRPGDEVRVVYEARHWGELPPDLPPFGVGIERAGEHLDPGRILAASYAGRNAEGAAFWVEGEDGRGSYYDAQGAQLRKTFLKSPLNYRRISSGFSQGRRHPITRKVVPHHGVDFAAAPGTPVVATADGRVVAVGWDGALGRAVRIRHGSEYVTIYGHLRSYARGVRRGVQVAQNQVIGYVGSSGRATGPHLHYSMLRGGRAINHMHFRNPPAEPLPTELRPRLVLAQRRWLSLIESPDAKLELAWPTRGAGPVLPSVPGV